MTIPQLRKRKPDGAIYTRPPEIEAKLIQLMQLSRDEIISRCAIRDARDARYVPSECLMHLVRQCRHDNSDTYFERLYRFLSARVLLALPNAENSRTNQLDLTRAKVREGAFDRFVALLTRDRNTYDDRLDYYEVRFDGAIANLRKDAKKPAFRDANRRQSIETSPNSGELPLELEAAARGYTPWDAPEFSEDNYRSRLELAISQLPTEQIRIVHMLRQNMPIDSKDPSVMTISKALRKSEKTVRLHRDKAIAAIREFFEREGKQ